MSNDTIDNSYNMQTLERADLLQQRFNDAFGHVESFLCEVDGTMVRVSYDANQPYVSTVQDETLIDFYAQQRERHRKKDMPTLGDQVWAFMHDQVGKLFTAANAERDRNTFNPDVPKAGK